jgi:hypothetical protein
VVQLCNVTRFVVLSAALVFCACGPGAPTYAPTFTNVRGQIISSGCLFSSCHVQGGPPKGLDLETDPHTALVGVASVENPMEKRVAANDPDHSYLLDKLLNRNLPMAPMGDQYSTWTLMPPPANGGPLESWQIELVRQWIAAGAKDD